MRLYRAAGAVASMPGLQSLYRAEIGRSLAIGPHDEVLRRHRSWMSTSVAQEAYRLRKQLVEPVFGIIKEQQGARRFLLRGLVNVAAVDHVGHRLQPAYSLSGVALQPLHRSI